MAEQHAHDMHECDEHEHHGDEPEAAPVAGLSAIGELRSHY